MVCIGTFGSRMAALLMCCVALGSAPSAAGEGEAAKALLEGAKVRAGGLCLHVGCGRAETPGLSAELAAQSSLLVHGLAWDEASVARARASIDARKLHGRAMIERGAGAALPYYDSLANLVVVEDEAELAQQGVTASECLRVLAPGGTLAVRRGGAWTFSAKPRPETMDVWTHPHHGPDGNLVSTDRALTFPVSLRWLDGIPVCASSVAGTRAWVANSRTLFAYGINELENVGSGGKGKLFLSARDAFNGLPLWKADCGGAYEGTGILWLNAGPLCCDEERVYVNRDGKLAILDAATGHPIQTCATEHPPAKLLVADGVLVAACWTEEMLKIGEGQSWLRIPQAEAGTIEAFEAQTGAPLWKLPIPALRIVAGDASVYVLVVEGKPAKVKHLMAVELASGKERWKVTPEDLKAGADLELSSAAPGGVVLSNPKAREVILVSQKDGAVVHREKSSGWSPVVDGLVWAAGKAIDLKTGEAKGSSRGGYLGGHHCSPSKLAGDFLLSGAGAKDLAAKVAKGEKAPGFGYPSIRGSCVEGMVPANGQLYNAQNNCKCYPAAIYGFHAFGSRTIAADAEAFAAPRPVERGPAFGEPLEAEGSDAEWPTFRGNAARSASSPAAAPKALNQKWSTRLCEPLGESTLEGAWKARLGASLTAPVTAGGMVFVAAIDHGRLHALDARTGEPRWSVSFGARIDSPPTVHRGLCLLGCHDGWVYALRAADGRLAWRARIAPAEARRVAYGQIESAWPAVGAVLVRDGVAYASAGRSSETDGGVALAAFKLETGETVWARALNKGALRLNDALSWRDEALAWHTWRFDPKTGATTHPTDLEDREKYKGGAGKISGPMVDGTWTRIRNRRAGSAFSLGEKAVDAMAWNAETALTFDGMFALAGAEARWKTNYNARAREAEALALASDGAILAGRVRATTEKPSAGFVAVWNPADGKPVAEAALAAPPVHEGLALAGGRVFVALYDGTVAAWGE